jgi:DNA-binding MarR family transcriptional regulator
MPTKSRTGSELAAAFESMMQRLLLLGHTLPDSAIALTPQQLKVLSTLDFLAAPTPMSKLSAELGVTPGTMTKVVAGLVRKSYVQKRRSTSDDRVVHVSLTREGRRAVTKIKEYRREFFMRVCDRLTPAACRKLIETHRHIDDTYGQILRRQKPE